jgi:hypothetical protein
MRYWVGVVDADRFNQERMYANDSVTVPFGGLSPYKGDTVALVAATEPPVLFGVGTVRGTYPGEAVVAYTHRLLDDPRPIPATTAGEVTAVGYHALTSGIGAGKAATSEWFVSVALPIEASSRAEAVREFWTYVDKLGPRELPAFVWPKGDELAMQAFVLGAETNLDPEEDDED